MKLSALILVMLGLALAEPYPELTDPYLNDFAQILSPEQAADIRTLFAAQQSQTGAEIVLVTVPSAGQTGYPGEAGLEEFSSSIYTLWVFKDLPTHPDRLTNGNMLLFVADKRWAMVELRAMYYRDTQRQEQAVFDAMTPAIQKGDYPAGLLAGAQELVKVLSNSAEASPSRPNPTQPAPDLPAQSAPAPKYPKRIDAYVNDFAQILSSAQASEIRELFQEHNNQNGTEIVLVTLPSLAEYGAKGIPVDTYAQELFDRWGIGNPERRNGILLLFSEGDREVRIQLGASYGFIVERQAEQVIDTMVPFFKEGHYSTGLYAGARTLVKIGNASITDWLLVFQDIFTKLFSWFEAALFLITIITGRILYWLLMAWMRRHSNISSDSYTESTYYSESSGDSGSSESRGGGRSTGAGTSGSWSSSSSSSSSSSGGGHSSSGGGEWKMVAALKEMVLHLKQLGILSGLLGTLALAQSYPQRVDTYVNDFAGILSTQATAEIRQLFDQRNNQKGIEIVLVTLPSLASYGAEGVAIEDYALSIFNLWAVGDWERDDGILLLFSEGDREVRIQLGASYGASAERQAEQVIDTMLPYFQAGDYSAGLLAGARGLLQIGRNSVLPSLPWQPQANPGTPASWLSQNWFWVALIAAFLLFVVIPMLSGLRRRSANSPYMYQDTDLPSPPLFPPDENRSDPPPNPIDSSSSWRSPSPRRSFSPPRPRSSSSSSSRSSSSSSSPSRGGGRSGGRGASGKW